MSNTYSFLNTIAVLTGPGGAGVSIGAGAGVDEEGITCEPVEDVNTMYVGADGEIMHSLNASKGGRFTVRLLKTSPMNAILSALLAFQRSASGNWGQNTIIVTDVARGDVNTLSTAAFGRQPVITYSKNPRMNEWTFVGAYNQLLGAG